MEATPAGITAGSPVLLKPSKPHHAISIPNGYHVQNNYATPNAVLHTPSAACHFADMPSFE